MKKSIIYVNYSPYENSGHILDYLNENFEHVFLFSLAHHTLRGRKMFNRVTYYDNGKLDKKIYMYYMQVPTSLVWIYLPIRSMVNAFQIFKECLKIYRTFGKVDYFFSVNAFAVSVGMLFKKLGLVKKTVFWVWDYYPLNYPGVTVKISRWMYWQFDMLSSFADNVVYLNKRLAGVRKKNKLIPKNKKVKIAPIGMGRQLSPKRKSFKTIRIGFIGVLKKSQGLEMLIDSSGDLASNFNKVVFEIIGSGPDERYFKDKARGKDVKFNFYGWVTEEKFKKILRNCTLGIAPYSPEKSNVSRYGDPGKVKRYLEFNLPSIITDVFEFSKELQTSKAGIVIKYGDSKQLISAIREIVEHYKSFQNNMRKIQKEYYYRKVYKVMFEFKS